MVDNIISSTLHDTSDSVLYNPTFNSMDKIVALYERIIQEKNEKIELYEWRMKDLEEKLQCVNK
ncbi:hypothetical protein FACS189446_3300 [Bacteroidia bacterium]|nr:hypothetical protein FACS189446_3300 [Bacteroidia bacterium]